MKLLLLGLTALALSNAQASVLLDWASVPEKDRFLQPTTKTPGVNGTYTTGADFSNVLVTVAGSDFAKQGSGLHDPKIDPQGHPYPVPVLSSVAEFRPQVSGTSATVEFTIAFAKSVRNVSFELFNVEADHIHNFKEVEDVVTFKTPGIHLTPSQDNVVNGETVTGIGSHGPASTGGPQSDVLVQSGNLPLKQIVFDWTEQIKPGTKDFLEEIAIGNIVGNITPVPEVGQLVIGLAAALAGGLILGRARTKVTS
jgi:hypothetical protein